jgi:hypothetical protein
MCKFELIKSKRVGKKFTAKFTNCTNKEIKLVHFGAAGMSDFTKHHDEERKQRYIARHSNNNENWNDPYTAGALSRYILWNKHTIEESVKDFKKRFGFE